MIRDLNPLQIATLRWVGEGCPVGSEPSESYKVSAVALVNRRLIVVTRRGGRWQAILTDAGRHYLDHGDYPTGHFLAKPVKEEPQPAPEPVDVDERPPPPVRRPSKPQRKVEASFEVESPARLRARGLTPRGDELRTDGSTDPWDERVLVSVKEAAWLLSVSENEIRRAVTSGDIQRVFIGRGTTHYRIVYGSLLAWVNDMPREPATQHWWRR